MKKIFTLFFGAIAAITFAQGGAQISLEENLDLGIFSVISGTQSDFFEVTFIVDMTDAVATGNIEFNPAIHNVYITGSQTGWDTPGSNQSWLLQPIYKNNSKAVYEWSEYWKSYNDWEVAGGETAGTNSLGEWTVINNKSGINNWGVSDFDFSNEGTDYGVIIFNPYFTSPPIDNTHPPVMGIKYAAFTQANLINDDKWLISPPLEVSALSVLSFWAKSITSKWGLERMKVLVSSSGANVEEFVQISEGDYIEVPDEWTEYTYNLGTYAGQTIHFAIQYVSYDAFFLFLDNFKVSCIGDLPNSNQYSITLMLEAGEYDYKYFFIEDNPTWDMGEWAGEPNRTINVTDNMVVYDYWGVKKAATIISTTVSNISQTDAISGGNVIDDGGEFVTAKGIVWGTSHYPSVSMNQGITIDGSGTGYFSSNLTGLSPKTTYFVRAYATNSSGTSYGNQFSFTTLDIAHPPTVYTYNVSNTSLNTSESGGDVTNDGDAFVTSKGVVWGTFQNPTLDSNNGITNDGTGFGPFKSILVGLTPYTTYYVRAYAINRAGISYGIQRSFISSLLNNIEENVDYDVIIYPNPFTNELSIHSIGGLIKIEIFSVDGKKIYEITKKWGKGFLY